MKIGFIYYTFYPVTGGASVHGYNLAKELQKLGYELYKLNGDPDPHTRKLKNPVTGLLRMLTECDLMYIRMDYFLNLRNLVTILALLSRKKIIVELNSPSDELHLFGRRKRYIEYADKVMSAVLKRTNAVITVSEPIREYCTKALGLNRVHVVENGGEIFGPQLAATHSVKISMKRIKKDYSKIVVWSGSVNEMQDLSDIQQVAGSQSGKSAIILIVNEDDKTDELPASSENENVFTFNNLPREDVKYILSNSHIGLALYRDYPWSRWDFYNSSLKMYEYLNNGLLTVTNTEGTECQRSYPNFRFAGSAEEIIRIIDGYEPRTFEYSPLRTWRKVAEETSEIIEEVVNP